MQKIRRSTSSSVFSSYFKSINHVYETGFSKHDLKKNRWILKICIIVDILSRPKIIEFLPRYGRKNLATTFFFAQRIKEKLNTRFGYSFSECCLLYFVVACFAVDIMSSELLNLVTDSPFIARLQVMTLAKDSSRSKFGLKQVFFFLTSKNTLSSSALECGITRINFTTLVSLGNFGHPMQSFHSAKIMQHTIVKNIFNGLDNFCFR